MKEIHKIGEVAAKFNISGRALRYYEEIGILRSIRSNESQYRYYDQEAMIRIEQILFLRKMQIPIKDIQGIFTSENVEIAINVLRLKLKNLEEETEMTLELTERVKAFLFFLQKQTNHNHNELKFNKIFNLKNHFFQGIHFEKEASEMMNEKFKELDDIRIIRLRPMKVAYYRAESASPETDAWNVMKQWVIDNGLEELATTRFFGFNNPGPTADRPEYGYEVWVNVPDSLPESGEIKIKKFEGGLYGVTCCRLHNISDQWKRLGQWVRKSEYGFGDHQWLEETISPDKTPNENTQFDLYYPVK